MSKKLDLQIGAGSAISMTFIGVFLPGSTGSIVSDVLLGAVRLHGVGVGAGVLVRTLKRGRA